MLPALGWVLDVRRTAAGARGNYQGRFHSLHAAAENGRENGL
jgi:hypothetical protein